MCLSHEVFFSGILLVAFTGIWSVASAQVTDDLASAGQMKKLFIDELMNLEVTSVSKVAEKLTVYRRIF